MRSLLNIIKIISIYIVIMIVIHYKTKKKLNYMIELVLLLINIFMLF